LHIYPNRNPGGIDLGVIKLHPEASTKQVQAELRSQLKEFVNIFTYEELLEYEKLYWANTAPIGFGTVMELVVGLVIVCQILFTDIANYRNEFATLKAMGYQHGYFIRVVFASAFFLALLGFIPG
tara:strand:- start:532 stop:906 length:375 start_codon:yes stop_codon:yes gene_type:complete